MGAKNKPSDVYNMENIYFFAPVKWRLEKLSPTTEDVDLDALDQELFWLDTSINNRSKIVILNRRFTCEVCGNGVDSICKHENPDGQPKTLPKLQTKKHIKRPMNAFFLWSKLERKKISEVTQDKYNQNAITKELGRRWKLLPEEARQPYFDEAERLRILHLQEYPDYKFQPRKKPKPAAGSASNQQKVVPETTAQQSPEQQSLQLHHHQQPPPVQPPPIQPFGCKFCKRQFTSMYQCIKHERFHNRFKDNLKSWTRCNTCDKPEKVKSNPTKTYSCKTCQKKFFWLTSLRFHEIGCCVSTIEDTPFICKTCGKGFKKKRYLDHHFKYTHGERRYVCKTCDKRFQRNTQLRTHMRVHTGEKPYKCKICGMTFTYSYNLRDHESKGICNYIVDEEN